MDLRLKPLVGAAKLQAERVLESRPTRRLSRFYC